MLRSFLLLRQRPPRFICGRFLVTKTPSDKDNFDKNVLQPAQRGQLAGHHASGIPKLAARKRKAHLTPPARRGMKPPVAALEDEDMDDEEEEALRLASGGERQKRLSANRGKAPADEFAEFGFHDNYYAASMINDNKYYWREEEFENLAPPEDENQEGEDEEVEIPYDKADFEGSKSYYLDENEFFGDRSKSLKDNDGDETRLEDKDGQNEGEGKRKEPWEYLDPEQNFFWGQFDICNIANLPENSFGNPDDRKENIVFPLRTYGDSLDDFMEASIEHPTRFARTDYINLHPNSQREPKPDFPRNRAQPPKEFVEAHARFLYVSGLPPLEVDGQTGDLNNPVHRSFLQKSIAGLVGVDSTRVFPASPSSGFVGFSSPKELAEAIRRGPSEKFISNPPDITTPPADHEFVKRSPPGTVALLNNMPPGCTAAALAKNFFPKGTEAGSVYGEGLTPDSFHFLSPTRVLIRFSTKEHAESALDSHMVQDCLEDLGQYAVSYLRARRELVHAGFTGPVKSKEMRVFGPRLIVDGDMPSRKFHISHARVLHLRNLDPTLTKEQISEAFQPFCVQRRDVQGSVEFVTCENGHYTGRAYVGFDLPGEAEAAVKAANGRVRLGDRTAVMRLVHDRIVPHRPMAAIEKRPERTVEELLQDLNNWEQHVDPADIAVLEQAGVSKTVLGEALRTFRFHNLTFGPLDSGLRSEALKPDTARGGNYKELVQLYVQTLKECLPTPDNVGDIYEGLHFPDEPIDLSIFDREKERQAMLHEKRANPP